MTDDSRDRLIRLETEVEHLNEKLGDVSHKVTVMHDLLMAAKGMKYLIVIMAAVAGFLASFASKYLPFSK